MHCIVYFIFFFFNVTSTTEIYTLSLHDALPIYREFSGVIREFGGASREIRSASRQLRNAGWSRGRKMCASRRCPTVTTLVCALPHSWAGLAQKDWEGATATAGKINGIRNGTWHTPQVPQCGSCVICAGDR